jgi:hypothetical protein
MNIINKKNNSCFSSLKSGEAAPLGTNVLFAAASKNIDKETGEILEPSSRKDRFSLQDVARIVLTSHEPNVEKKHNIHSCCRIPTSKLATILKSKTHHTAFYGNLATCKNIWACPVCASIVSEKRKEEVREACKKAEEMGLKVTMITLTTRHGIGDKLSDLMQGITGAFRTFTSHRTFKKYRDIYGVRGFVKATEVTYSDNNGFHPHFHILMFSQETLPKTFSWENKRGKIEKRNLGELWQTCCDFNGLPVPTVEIGFKISDENITYDQKVADYLSKFGDESKIPDFILQKAKDSANWDASAELTKWHSKHGRSESLTPFDFLRLVQPYVDTGKENEIKAKYSNLFRDFVLAMYRRSQLQWSRGLRDFFDMDPEKTDGELIEENEDTADIFACLVKSEMKKIVLKGLRSEVLHAAELSNFESFARYLHSITENKQTFSSYFKDFEIRLNEVKALKELAEPEELYSHAVETMSKYDNVTQQDRQEYKDQLDRKRKEILNRFSFEIA